MESHFPSIHEPLSYVHVSYFHWERENANIDDILKTDDTFKDINSIVGDNSNAPLDTSWKRENVDTNDFLVDVNSIVGHSNPKFPDLSENPNVIVGAGGEHIIDTFRYNVGNSYDTKGGKAKDALKKYRMKRNLWNLKILRLLKIMSDNLSI